MLQGESSSLDSAGIAPDTGPTLHIYAGSKKRETHQPIHQTLSSRLTNFAIPSPISTFTYANQTKMVQNLRITVAALNTEMKNIKLAEKQHWNTWDDNQKALAEWSVYLTGRHPIRLKRGWARFRYVNSWRRKNAYDVHHTTVLEKCTPLV